jgi:hypothetical protein
VAIFALSADDLDPDVAQELAVLIAK